MTGDAIAPIGAYGMPMDNAYFSYSSYPMMTDPMMSSVYGYGMGGMSPSMMGMSGMGGMNPMYSMAYMQEAMQQMQERMEKYSAKHNLEMHGIMANNDVESHNQTFEQQCLNILRNSDNAHMLNVLKTEINNGNSKGIIDAYKSLELGVLNTCRDLLEKAGDNSNRALQIKHLINNWYAMENGITFDEDVKKHCSNPFAVGFQNGIRPGNDDVSAEEVISACQGIEIKGKESKKTQQNVGKVVGNLAGAAETAIAGTALTGIGGVALGAATIPFANIGLKTTEASEVAEAKKGLKKLLSNNKSLNYSYKNGLKTFAKVSRFGLYLAPAVGISLAVVDLIAPGTIRGLLGKCTS